jgi:hypothetical protein
MELKVLRAAAVLIAAGVMQFLAQQALADGPLKYQFKGMNEACYQVSIKADLPDSVETKTGTIIYQIKAGDPANGQIAFGYSSHFSDQSQSKTPNNNRFPSPPPMPTFPSMIAPLLGAAIV